MESMPGDLQKPVSLQTLTCFVAGPTGSECSDVGELQLLNLGGQLELHQLENVTEEAAKVANIRKKKELRELKLKWTVGCEDDAKVLKALKPHDGLQAVRIESYGGANFPAWMSMSRNMVEIHLHNCKKLQWLFSSGTSFTFPNLKEFTLRDLECLERWWELSNEELGKKVLFPQLEKLSIVGCPKLKALPEATLLGESYGTMARSAFPALKELKLKNLQSFKSWEAVEGTQRGHIVFPKLEKITIKECLVLIALPEAALLGESYGTMARSAFPALKELKLKNLQSFKSWEAVEGTQRGHIIFPKLEKITIKECPVLIALPEAALFGESYGTMARSAFPALKELELQNLQRFESWETVEGTQGGYIVFPKLEELKIEKCPMLKALPEPSFDGDYSMARSAFPALKVLKWESTRTSEEDMFLWVARHKTLLINVELGSCGDTKTTLAAADDRFTQVVDAMQKGNHNDFPLTHLKLVGFKSGGTELYAYFIQLQRLEINGCAALVHWPEKEFQSLVSLKSLVIKKCEQLVGYAQTPAAEPSATSESSSELLPRLESLEIYDCGSMLEVFRLPASLRKMVFRLCSKLKSVFSTRLQQEQSAALILQEPPPVYSEVSSSPVVARTEHLPFPCLEDIRISWCDSFTGVLYLPPSLKEILIYGCGGLRSVESHSGEFPSLEHKHTHRSKACTLKAVLV
jgi:hypothetical protein